MKAISEMLRVSKAALAASKLINNSVVQQNPDVLDLAAECISLQGEAVLFGVKDTVQIQRKLLQSLTANGRYVWHTVDTMAEGGRAVDMTLTNPLTGRPMTGSSAATTLHVLQGINDVGVGTDGGGSVLGPALSLSLCSVMGKGLGLSGVTTRQSTDGISFLPGIGVISHSFRLAAQTVLLMAGIETDRLQSVKLAGLKAVIPAKGAVTLPDGSDMSERLAPGVEIIRQSNIEVSEAMLPDCMNRQQAIEQVGALLNEQDLLVTFEGPVDVAGLGDSVFGTWGPAATRSQAASGKYMIKIANMLNATAVTVPMGDAACGIVVLARQGTETGLAAIALGVKLAAAFSPPALFVNYFRDGWQRRKNDLLFSLEDGRGETEPQSTQSTRRVTRVERL